MWFKEFSIPFPILSLLITTMFLADISEDVEVASEPTTEKKNSIL